MAWLSPNEAVIGRPGELRLWRRGSDSGPRDLEVAAVSPTLLLPPPDLHHLLAALSSCATQMGPLWLGRSGALRWGLSLLKEDVPPFRGGGK